MKATSRSGLAEWLCADHELSYGANETSPLAKLVAAEAKILMIGAPLDTITLLHHSEHVARLTNKRIVQFRRKILVESKPTWVDIEEFETSKPVVEGMPEDNFEQIAAVALERGAGHHGIIGRADSYLFDARKLHEIGVAWLENWQRNSGPTNAV